MEDERLFPRMIQPRDCAKGSGGCLCPVLVAEAVHRDSFSVSVFSRLFVSIN